MQVSFEIDDELIREALRTTGLTTDQEVVEEGLRTLLRLRRQASLHDLRGIGWEGDLDDMRLDKVHSSEHEAHSNSIRELRGTVRWSKD